ncbi:hypothetical protein [Pareuzebyella sediminis]|uniref:hypothetical protein n=1 Tax=Pareuzebyella sediminis TaxID=2607998 RepID=UPI0011F06BBD|nr:hypothetical protein [Pareuzebyella sediminis]
MKNKILLFVLGILAITTTSCKEEKDSPKMKEVLAIHDEVMPKMTELGNLVGELSSKEDSTALGMQYKEARIELQAAHKSMMDWMQNFGNRFTPDEVLNGKELTDQKKLWLDEEEEKVLTLRQQVNSSIEKAKKLLEQEN